MIELTDSEVSTRLRALVVKEGEDFIYTPRRTGEYGATKCHYVYEGRPDCLVGRFLAESGVPLERLAEADNGKGGAGVCAGDLVTDLEEEGFLLVSDRALQALQAAQSSQDVGETWGTALRRAERRLAQ